MHALRREKGGYAAEVPVDSVEANLDKVARTQAAYERLGEAFRAAKPDVVVVLGDDQDEQFDSRNHPAFAVFVGEAFSGYRAVAYEPGPVRKLKPRTPEHWTDVRAAPELGRHLLLGLMDEDFDPAYMTSLPNEEFGMGHAIMRPLQKLTQGRFDVPVVPVLINGVYPPQPSGRRCAALGLALRKLIESWPRELNVAVLGSGGLWHTPGAPESYLDEEFDQEMLRCVSSGDVAGMARYFDEWKSSTAREGLRCFEAFKGKTQVLRGLGSGTGEVRNWIAAAAVAGRPGTVVDYVPVYASPCGMGFTYWDMN